MRSLMEALEAAGDRAGALQVADAHATLLHREFDAEPDPAVVAFAERMRRAPRAEASTKTSTAASKRTQDNPTAGANGHASIHSIAAPDTEQDAEQVITRFAARSWLRKRRRLTLLLASFSFAAAAVVVALLGFAGRSSRSTLDPTRIAIAPFRVSAPDSSLNSLREGGVDLLHAHFAGDESLKAVDSRTTIGQWRGAANESGDVTMERALGLARGLGAGRLLTVELVVQPLKRQSAGSCIVRLMERSKPRRS